MQTDLLPTEDTSRRDLFRGLARWAWLSLLVDILLNVLAQRLVGVVGQPGMTYVPAGIFALCALTGLLAGVIALSSVRRYGRKGLLAPALTGVCLWLLLIAAGSLVFVKLQSLTAKRPATALTPATHAPGAPQIEDAESGYKFDLPDGYEEIPRASLPTQYQQGFLRAVVGEPKRVLLVTRWPNPLPRHRLTDNDLAGVKSAGTTTLTSFMWRGLEVDAMRVLETKGDIKYLTFNVQIPLRKDWVQLGVGGSAESEGKLRELVGQILSSFDGETNW